MTISGVQVLLLIDLEWRIQEIFFGGGTDVWVLCLGLRVVTSVIVSIGGTLLWTNFGGGCAPSKSATVHLQE